MSELKTFPRTTVAGVSMPRMIAGTNWILGYSHTGGVADKMIRERHADPRATADLLAAFLEEGVDALMAPYCNNQNLIDAVKMAEDRVGRKMIVVDTPIIDVTDSAEGRRNAEALIAKCQRMGATFCLIHHVAAEKLVNKGLQAIPRLPDYLAMIRDHGMIPGLSAHMPELVLYSDANGYDVQTYIQIFNCAGFLMQVEIESVYKIIQDAKKPVMTIKPMAAGRVTPFVGITFNFAVLRDCDMVTVGCLTADEAKEDVEIARAAIERRRPSLEGRHSPAVNSIIK